MSNLTAPVVDGKIQAGSTSASSLSSSKTKSSSSLDKDAFLQLLVAQMKYQDPLEPTSNTEYVSQLATFSELEEMQNMSSGMSLQRASSLVGKNVMMKVTNATTGATENITGRVDYVVVENGKAYLSINEALYSIDDLDTIVDDDYLAALNLASAFKTSLEELPTTDELTLNNADAVAALRKTYDGLTSYQKSFVAASLVTKLTDAEAKIAKLKGA